MRNAFLRILCLSVVGAIAIPLSLARQGMMDPMGTMRKMQSSPVMLVGMGDVKKELKLTGDQGKKIDAIRKAHEKQMTGLRRTPGDITGAMAAMKEFEAATEMANADIRTELQPEQVARLRALEYQAMGSKALYEKDLQVKLDLSADQVAKIEAHRTGEMGRLQEMFGAQGVRNPSEMQRKMKEAREANEKALMGVLTSDQATKYREILGAPVKAVIKLSEMGF